MSTKNDKTLFNEAADEVVEESWGSGGSVFGGAPGGGAGTFNWASRLRATQSQAGKGPNQPGSPPFRGMTGGPNGINIQDIAREGEEFAKQAGKNKMYPLENVNELLVDAVLALTDAETQLHSCVKFNKVLTTNPEKKALLNHCFKKVGAIKEMIRGISADFDRITLS